MESHAVVFPKANEVVFQEITCPDPGPEDVVIDVHHSWISNGTEGSFLRGERVNGETPWQPGAPWPFPIAAGYQSTGVVMHVGRDDEDGVEGAPAAAREGDADDTHLRKTD